MDLDPFFGSVLISELLLQVRLSNVADNPVKPDAPQTMLLNMNGADGDVECRIVAPSGREDDCFITPLGHGEHSVRLVTCRVT